MGEGKKKLQAKLTQFNEQAKPHSILDEAVAQNSSHVETKNNCQTDSDQLSIVSDLDQEVMVAARRFMDRHPNLLTRLAK